jgi:peptidoglycan hydrolase-like protein with peptidoglycan-binding domain
MSEEEFAWNLVKLNGDATALEAFIRRFPNGEFTGEAFTQLRSVGEEAAAPVEVATAPLDPTPGGREVDHAISMAEVRSFIEYISSSEPAEDVATFVATSYAEQVIYYGNPSGRQEVIDDKLRWYGRWQDWTVTPIGSPVLGERTDGAYDLTYRFSYEWVGKAGTGDAGNVLTGEAAAQLVIRKVGNRIVILAESSELLGDQDGPARSSDIVVAIQQELVRAGCNPGTADGIWGKRSQSAVDAFATNAGVRLRSDPSAELLAALKAKPGRICPEVLAPVVAETNVPVATSDCAVISVTASPTDPAGDVWDWAINGDPEPDILISELTTGQSARCDNSFSCRLQASPIGDSVSLNIVDYDNISRNQLMGEGQCRVGDTCNFPNATVTVSRC